MVISEFELTRKDIRILDGHIKYLSAAVDRLNKFDWKGVALGTIIAIIIQLTLDTEKGQRIFEFFQRVFSYIIYLPPSV